MNEKWECFLCSKDFSDEESVSGYLSNYHPLCKICSDKSFESDNIQLKRMTYHYKLGEIILINNVVIPNNRFNRN